MSCQFNRLNLILSEMWMNIKKFKKNDSNKIHTTRIWNILIDGFYKLNEKIVFKDNTYNYDSLTSFRKLNRKLLFKSLR